MRLMKREMELTCAWAWERKSNRASEVTSLFMQEQMLAKIKSIFDYRVGLFWLKPFAFI